MELEVETLDFIVLFCNPGSLMSDGLCLINNLGFLIFEISCQRISAIERRFRI